MIREVRIGNLQLEKGNPKICVPVMGTSREEVIWEVEQLKKVPCDIIEWRTDCYCEDIITTAHTIKNIVGDIPLLITYRTKKEGGKGSASDKHYTDIMKNVILSRVPNLVDIELSCESCHELIELAKSAGMKTIISYHNFEETPSKEDMSKKFKEMEELGGDIPKIAVMPKNFSDVLTLLETANEVSEENSPIIAISMGNMGKISRITPQTGTALTFASCKTASAPGQIKAEKIDEYLKMLR